MGELPWPGHGGPPGSAAPPPPIPLTQGWVPPGGSRHRGPAALEPVCAGLPALFGQGHLGSAWRRPAGAGRQPWLP